MNTATPNFQKSLVALAAEKLSRNELLVDVIADILDISKDAAYRRMQGRTEMSFNEAASIAEHFDIALSALQTNQNTIQFNSTGFIKTIDDYRAYMQNTLEYLQMVGKESNHVLYYMAKDVPVFYHFGFKKLAAFKIYVWLKSVYNIQKIDGKNYSINDIPQDLLDLAHEQWKAFTRLNTVEFWNNTTVVSVLQQLEYFYDAGLLSSQEEGLEICQEFSNMIKLIYKQALSGNKVHANSEDLPSGAYYKMYYHEILLMDNHIYAKVDEKQGYYFIPLAGISFLSTNNGGLATNMEEYIIEQAKKASLISEASEKVRNQFFIGLSNQISKVREKISQPNF